MNRITRTLAIAALAAGLLPATALADCAREGSIQQMFQEFDGDANYYFVAPGGTFEGRIMPTITGATRLIAATHRVTRAGTKAALSMTTNATVTTGAVCVDNTRTWARFLYKRNSASGTMKVEAIRSNGSVTLLSTIDVPRSMVWSAASLVPLARPLAIPVGGDTLVRLRITASGNWDVDGIAVDPYRRA